MHTYLGSGGLVALGAIFFIGIGTATGEYLKDVILPESNTSSFLFNIKIDTRDCRSYSVSTLSDTHRSASFKCGAPTATDPNAITVTVAYDPGEKLYNVTVHNNTNDPRTTQKELLLSSTGNHQNGHVTLNDHSRGLYVTIIPDAVSDTPNSY